MAAQIAATDHAASQPALAFDIGGSDIEVLAENKCFNETIFMYVCAYVRVCKHKHVFSNIYTTHVYTNMYVYMFNCTCMWILSKQYIHIKYMVM